MGARTNRRALTFTTPVGTRPHASGAARLRSGTQRLELGLPPYLAMGAAAGFSRRPPGPRGSTLPSRIDRARLGSCCAARASDGAPSTRANWKLSPRAVSPIGGCGRRSAGGLEQLDRISGGVLQQDLVTAHPDDDVITEVGPSRAEAVNFGLEIGNRK